ncbi:MAG: FHA domain-containing protein, partial [Chloroflexota bacterium]|nr:FHA domain-containing protein [Chloroflexota bacterium]
GGPTRLMVFGVVVLVAAVAAFAFWYIRLHRRRRLLRAQRAIVEPNARLAAEQGVPQRAPDARAAEAPVRRGRLVEPGVNGDAGSHELGDGPFAIGSSPRLCRIVLPAEAGVAPEHLRITLLNGTYRLHHVGGAGRRTLVGGRPADFVTLEPGDEIQVGSHRFVFEEE